MVRRLHGGINLGYPIFALGCAKEALAVTSYTGERPLKGD